MQLDEIGPWSEIKLEIVKKYAAAYSKILHKQRFLRYYYIDGFAGPGMHIKKRGDNYVPGSPLNALNITPPFEHYYFIDMSSEKISLLQNHVGQRSDVTILNGDCNKLLPNCVFPEVRREDYKRALCFLDPYGLHLDWNVVRLAGKMQSIEVFINFPVLDINRNIRRKRPDLVPPVHVERMNRFWGDNTWSEVAFDKDLFGEFIRDEAGIDPLVRAYTKRLIEVAGFKYVPSPLAMHASGKAGALLYYIFFASCNEVANKIVSYIFKKYREIGSL
jgi:three-Cys-motif partner protein